MAAAAGPRRVRVLRGQRLHSCHPGGAGAGPSAVAHLPAQLLHATPPAHRAALSAPARGDAAVSDGDRLRAGPYEPVRDRAGVALRELRGQRVLPARSRLGHIPAPVSAGLVARGGGAVLSARPAVFRGVVRPAAGPHAPVVRDGGACARQRIVAAGPSGCRAAPSRGEPVAGRAFLLARPHAGGCARDASSRAACACRPSSSRCSGLVRWRSISCCRTRPTRTTPAALAYGLLLRGAALACVAALFVAALAPACGFRALLRPSVDQPARRRLLLAVSHASADHPGHDGPRRQGRAECDDAGAARPRGGRTRRASRRRDSRSTRSSSARSCSRTGLRRCDGAWRVRAPATV